MGNGTLGLGFFSLNLIGQKLFFQAMKILGAIVNW
jgi:hypothetical protein